MKNKSIREMVLSGLFIAIGIILPMAFHAFGLGSTFSPMHIPVLLAGFVIGPFYAASVGVITPILSSLFTGLPPAFPVLPYMVFELATYGLITSILYRKFRQNIYVSLVASMVAGRIVSGIIVWIIATLFTTQLPSPVAFVIGSVTGGIPGIIIQIIFIPLIVMMLNRNSLILREEARKEVKNES